MHLAGIPRLSARFSAYAPGLLLITRPTSAFVITPLSIASMIACGEVDMLLGNTLEIGGEFRMVASFQAQPYYIVTTVGNTEILEGLNTALHCILESTPDFADKVYYANSRISNCRISS